MRAKARVRARARARVIMRVRIRFRVGRSKISLDEELAAHAPGDMHEHGAHAQSSVFTE